MKPEAYWERRRQLEDKARAKMENETIKALSTDVLPNALKKIQEKLLSQSKLHNMTQNELLADFNKQDQKKYREYIDKNYLDLMQSDESYQAFIDEFFPSYDYAKINQLTQIRADIFNILASEMIKTDVNQKFNDRLEKIVNNVYDSNSKAMFQLLGAGTVQPLPKKELDEMLNYPWSGKTFSTRLWGNVSRLEQNLSQAIVNAVASGDGVAEVLKSMKGNQEIPSMFKLEESKFNRAIENLVRTEYAHFAVEGIEKSYKDAGIEKYRNYSAEDELVCSTCGAMHGKVFKVSEGVAGVTKPVWHTKCRCTTTPVMKDLPEDIDEIYEEMFGDLLDEFAKDNFGVTLTHPKASRKKEDKTAKGDIIINDSIKAKTSTDNIEEIKRILSKAPENMQKLWNKYAEEFNWISNIDGDYYHPVKKGVYLLDKNLKNATGYKDFDIFFHEFAHHIDGLAGRDAGYSMFSHFADEDLGGLVRQEAKDCISKLKKDIAKEAKAQGLTKGEMGTITYKGAEMKIAGGTVANRHAQNVIKSELISLPAEISGDISDIWEGATKGNVTGSMGHGKDYWTDIYKLPSEAFAEMTSATINNPESLKLIIKYFPKSYEAYLKMVDTILGG